MCFKVTYSLELCEGSIVVIGTDDEGTWPIAKKKNKKNPKNSFKSLL